MSQRRKESLQGTLDLLVLRTLSAGAAMHGFAIAERIDLISDHALRVEEGSLYPALHRMEEAGWIKSEWTISDNSRRARYYRLTAKGRRHLTDIEQSWTKHVEAVRRVLRLA